MPCLNCLNCLGYSGGKLGAVTGDNIECTAAGELELVSDATVKCDDVAVDPDLIEDCSNGVKITGTRLWMPPTPCAECFQDEFNGFIGPSTTIGDNQVYFTPTAQLSLPAACDCLESKYMIAVKRFIRFDQDAGSDYAINDVVNGTTSPYPTAQRFTTVENRHFSYHSEGWMFTETRPAGSGPFNIGFQIRVRTFGNDVGSNGVVYQYGWKWSGVKICM